VTAASVAVPAHRVKVVVTAARVAVADTVEAVARQRIRLAKKLAAVALLMQAQRNQTPVAYDLAVAK
jgi:hypothetical protein